ncbi:Uncharacterized protein Fot_17530 [Forsythia ovata]|uniref:Uncharacterized protein n=1 Tax=Forsythia ovata TaxID=205694 RepID=A0ABD1VFL4_9LAMI
MGLADLNRAQLNTIIQSMVAEDDAHILRPICRMMSSTKKGVVNNQFVQLQTMKVTAGKDFMLRSVISYWKAVKYLFTQLTNQIVGAVYVSFACRDIIEGCHAGDKNRLGKDGIHKAANKAGDHCRETCE